MARITKEYMLETCKVGQDKECCRYITVGANGFDCEKLGPLKSTFDLRVEVGYMNAQGDNCDGLDNIE
jgi:hypothetical protein